MTYHPTHNCIFLSLQCPQNIPIESENVCAGCCTGKAQSKQPAATPHILKVCFGSVPIHGRGVQKDSFVQPENQWFPHGSSWLWLLEFYLQQYESFLIVQEINHQRTPPLYPYFAEERFSLQIYPVTDPLHFYFSTKRYTGYLQTQFNVERRDYKLQGLKRKVYQPGPNLKAGFSAYKVWQFPHTLVHNCFAEMERTGWKAWKVGESQDTWVLSRLSHCVIILSHLPSFGRRSSAPKEPDLPSTEFWGGKSHVLEKVGWKENEWPVFPCLSVFFLGPDEDFLGTQMHSETPATEQGEGLFLQLG